MISVLEWFVLALVALGIIKVLVVFKDPKDWYKVVEVMFKRPALVEIVSILGAFIVLRFLLMELTIVQIFGSMVFMTFLIMAMYAVFPEIILQMTKKVLSDKKVLRRAWIVSVFWIGLMIWVVWAIIVGM